MSTHKTTLKVLGPTHVAFTVKVLDATHVAMTVKELEMHTRVRGAYFTSEEQSQTLPYSLTGMIYSASY